MRRLSYILVIALLLAPLTSEAITGSEHREDWSLGQATVVANSTSTCNDTATARFDWSLGQPVVVIDSTANCTAAAGSPSTAHDIFWFE